MYTGEHDREDVARPPDRRSIHASPRSARLPRGLGDGAAALEPQAQQVGGGAHGRAALGPGARDRVRAGRRDPRDRPAGCSSPPSTTRPSWTPRSTRSWPSTTWACGHNPRPVSQNLPVCSASAGASRSSRSRAVPARPPRRPPPPPRRWPTCSRRRISVRSGSRRCPSRLPSRASWVRRPAGLVAIEGRVTGRATPGSPPRCGGRRCRDRQGRRWTCRTRTRGAVGR
jgi:hypothetical protein